MLRLAHVSSLFVMMDEESVHVLSLEDDVGCVVAVEARELLAESGRARQTAGGTTVSCVYQGVSRGVHSIVRRLRTNPPRKINLRFFFSFCFLPPRLVFLQTNRKRMSLTGFLLQHSN